MLGLYEIVLIFILPNMLGFFIERKHLLLLSILLHYAHTHKYTHTPIHTLCIFTHSHTYINTHAHTVLTSAHLPRGPLSLYWSLADKRLCDPLLNGSRQEGRSSA